MLLNLGFRIFNATISVLSFFYNCTLFTVLLLLPSRYSRKLDIITTTLPRDVKTLFGSMRFFIYSYYYKKMNHTAYSAFEKAMKKTPNKACFIFGSNELSFKMVDNYSGRVANVFTDLGYKKGDVVAILVNNCPEYVCLWLGLSRIGVISSLLNVSLRGQSLKYCIEGSQCKAVIFANEYTEAVLSVRLELESTVRYFQLCGPPIEGVSNLDNFLTRASDSYYDPSVTIDHTDHLVYVFTSGTTGLPKAAIITHSRYLMMGTFSKILLGINRRDRAYVPLPLHHMAGGLLGASMSIILGCTGVLTNKFSATNYIPDCIKYQCTVAMFIGEMCRYVLAIPPRAEDREHKLRMIVSTGLRRNVWEQFTQRFGIEMVREIYGATEGNVQFANLDNKVGAVGFVPQCFPHFIRRRFGVLVKFDPETEEPSRGENGFCTECQVDEIGMLLGLIPNNSIIKMFHGYIDKEESKKKIIHNVFQNGDKAFVTGDLMTMDKYGYLYFKDRTGDTFRWKGENVSTFEVETLISSLLKDHECIVYGVQVGDCEGKAGMAAIVDPHRIVDLNELAVFLEKNLPKFAIPLFIRLLSQIELTGSFRLKKSVLKKEGFNLDDVEDPLYIKDGKLYVELTEEIYEGIINGAITI